MGLSLRPLEVAGGASEFLYSPTVNEEADVHFSQPNRRQRGGYHACSHWGRCRILSRIGGCELPTNLKIITLPAYSPELNPLEKFWDIVKDTICNTAWPNLAALEDQIPVILRNYGEGASRVMSLFSNSSLRSELNGSRKPPWLIY